MDLPAFTAFAFGFGLLLVEAFSGGASLPAVAAAGVLGAGLVRGVWAAR